MSWTAEVRMGELRPWPDAVRVVRGNTDDTQVYVPERTAKRVRVPYQSHVAIGHYECGACGETVEPSDRYCSACGARLEDE